MKTIGWRQAAGWTVAAVAAFHAAYELPPFSWLMAVYLFCLFRLTWVSSERVAFRWGLVLGMLIFSPQLTFFWTIFGPFAIALWGVLALWVGVFLMLARWCIGMWGWKWAAVLTPVLWTGIEYFRSELYYLKFSWLTPGLAMPPEILRWTGTYGFAFLAITLIAALHLLPRKPAWILTSIAIAAGMLTALNLPVKLTPGTPDVVGIQTEHLPETAILRKLEEAVALHPQAKLFVLSEYAFDEIPSEVREWCASHEKYLIAGAIAYYHSEPRAFRDTAFVIGPDGKTAFSQAKSVPIQFFNDGLPAKEQKLWDSPWGKIGIGVCYDLSYTRVTDRLVRMGAQAIICPTMDAESWGERQHLLHSRIGTARAAEYRIPVMRAASSGISQIITAQGNVRSGAGFPGIGQIYAGKFPLAGAGRLPLDRHLAPLCTAGTAAIIVALSIQTIRRSFAHQRRRNAE